MKKFLSFVMLSLFVLSASASSSESNDFKLEYNQDDLSVKYGEYSEIEFFVQNNGEEQLNFEISSMMKPVGMNIVPLESNSFLLSGMPEFVSKFCFLVKTTSNDSEKESIERVCLISEDNEKLNHPKFKTQRHLESFQKSNFKEVSIELEREFNNITPEFIQGQLPEGIDTESNRGELSISGKTNYAGVFEVLVLALKQSNTEEFYVYKQFQLEVKDQIVNRYQCDIGYYFDETLGYCVQNSGTTCPTGTFYDPEVNSCVNYQRPTHVSCSVGSYYDHFLNRCVRNSYQRCPYNYEYDSYFGKCVRSVTTCSIGYRYSYRFNSCIYAGINSCAAGSHYSTYRGRCVSNYAYCRSGQYWDGYTCRLNTRRCRTRAYWDPHYGQCRTRRSHVSCNGGYRYDHGSLRCVRRSVYSTRTCRGGTRYSSVAGRCVSYRPTHTRPQRPVVRPNRRRPDVVRPNRPTHRPNRPTTRPDRPTRPNRPSTRPSRPNRSSGSSSTTRPDRPSRSSGSSTRPDRPSRSSGSSSRGSGRRTRP